MSPENEVKSAPGYQGSEKSSAEIIIYPQKGQPFVFQGGGIKTDPVTVKGKTLYDIDSALHGIGTSKSMGTPSGSWYASIKPTRDKTVMSLLESVNDDDWVDIVFYRHGRAYHVMRGVVDELRENTSVSGNGATTRVITLSGRDFGAVWEKTNIWFSPLIDQEFVPGVNLQVFGGQQNIYGSPTDVVKGFLIEMLRKMGSYGRAVWMLPSSIPADGGKSFADVIEQYFETPDSGGKPPYVYSNNPLRVAINPNYLTAEGNLWNLAQEWSDPAFCELYADTLPSMVPVQDDAEVPIKGSGMKLVLRDRPFPTVDSLVANGGQNSPWFSLPTHTIPQQVIGVQDLGRSGMERFNSFHLSPQLIQEILGGGVADLMMPLWDMDSIKLHGMRRYDIMSHYATDLVAAVQSIAAAAGGGPVALDLFSLSEYQRRRIRDWYCLNPYFLNGTISLQRGFPWIHIGERVKIIDAGSPKTDKMFYVEKVDHSWTFGSTIKTTLGVTRGWQGPEKSILDALSTISGNYQIPKPKP